MSRNPVEILRRYWGFEIFRPLQEEIINTVLAGKDCVALLPTGGGKSICFQVPALALDGVTLVISPLIALMNDQVNQLKNRGIAAASIHSGMHRQEIIRLLDAAQFGKLRLLYISPERLKQSDFILRLHTLPLSLLVIDEAHCISMWGYDFRPAYLEIAEVRKAFPEVPLIALTASATAEVIKDISTKLTLRQPLIHRSEFLRPNLRFGVLGTEDKKQRVLSLLDKFKGAAIVYVRSRRQARELAQLLVDAQLAANYYHAGLSREERVDRETDFFANRYKIMVATNAFGMGIDKADIRMVIHYDIPESLEAYYQEAGRAGRDGKDAYAIALYNDGDQRKLERQFLATFPEMGEVKRIYRALGNYLKLAIGAGVGQSFPFDIQDFVHQYKLDAAVTWNTLKLLEQGGWLVLSDSFYQPATVKIIASRAVLNEYQGRNQSKEVMIRALLRLYQGIMLDAVPIRDKQLAKAVHLNRKDLLQQLQELQSDGILIYRPQNEKPRLTMLLERVAYNNLTIDQSLFNFRKQKRRSALDQMLAYLQLKDCRQEFILNYFDASTAIACGICDNCRIGKRTRVDDKSFHQIRQKILKYLAEGERRIAQVIAKFPADDNQAVLRVMQYLLNEEIIRKSDEMISVNSENGAHNYFRGD